MHPDLLKQLVLGGLKPTPEHAGKRERTNHSLAAKSSGTARPDAGVNLISYVFVVLYHLNLMSIDNCKTGGLRELHSNVSS
jgi:hypothetical protein